MTGNADANTSLSSPLYNSADQFRVTDLAGSETSRIIQLISRISW